ncbi:MAG: diaminobutyrate acetyltransferase [Agarilytica sp.]
MTQSLTECEELPPQKQPSQKTETIDFRQPTDRDGPAVYALVENSPPLDTNSRYCNLLQCLHFADTCIAAFKGEKMVGFVSGYCIPKKTDTLFIWQVAVDESVRGQGLAHKMITQILKNDSCSNVQFIETTITADNQSSWALFEKLAVRLDARTQKTPLFLQECHFDGKHDTETLMRIGPFSSL